MNTTDPSLPQAGRSPSRAGLSLADARRRAGLTQEELAERSGISARSIGDIERGVVRRPRNSSLLALADALGLGPDGRDDLIAHYRGPRLPPPPQPPDRPAPAQLPRDITGFTGRDDDLDRLDAWLAGDGPIAVITGTAGVGKTALALHWAHQVRDRFPDGQLHVHLRGYGPLEPLDPEQALEQLLIGVGVPPGGLPAGVDVRAALLRTRLADRRILLLLDDAAHAEQVRPLLPGGSQCRVLVTSRDQLRGLAVRDGAEPIALRELAPADAIRLLARTVGEERVTAEPEMATELIGLCARLPLAIRIVGDRAARDPDQPLAAVVARLRGRQDRLTALRADADDVSTDLRAVFYWSYRALDQGAARLFRLLGLHPGTDIEAPAAAALAGVDPDRIGPPLDALTKAHLLERRSAGRYGFHDLLRLYAAAQSEAVDPPAERDAALDRLLTHYRDAAAHAMDALYPHEKNRRPAVSCPTHEQPEPDVVRAWLDSERGTLRAMAEFAAATGRGRCVRDLSAILWRHLDSAAHYDDAIAIHGAALIAAQADRDRQAESDARHNLGAAQWRSGRYRAAIEQLERALRLRRELGDTTGQTDTLTNLAGANSRLGRPEVALEHLRAALALRVQLGNRRGQAGTLDNLGVMYERLGRYPEALAHHQEALEVFRALGHKPGEAAALDNIGTVHQRLGRYAEAFEAHWQALAICRELGNRTGEGHTLTNLGTVQAALGEPDQALALLELAGSIRGEDGDRAGAATTAARTGMVLLGVGRIDEAAARLSHALSTSQELGDRQLETEAHNGLGEAHRAAGRLPEAIAEHRAAIALAVETSDRFEQARGLTVLAAALAQAGDSAAAAEATTAASAIQAALGIPH